MSNLMGKIEINGTPLEQLWYGLSSATVPTNSPIKVAKNSVYKSYSCKNEFVYTKEPTRDLAGNLRNDDIETFYVPTVSIELGYINIETYSSLIKLINTKSFTVKYFDYELLKVVERDMYMSEDSMNELHYIGYKLANGSYDGDIKGINGGKLTFVSRVAYKDYTQLLA